MVDQVQGASDAGSTAGSGEGEVESVVDGESSCGADAASARGGRGVSGGRDGRRWERSSTSSGEMVRRPFLKT